MILDPRDLVVNESVKTICLHGVYVLAGGGRQNQINERSNSPETSSVRDQSKAGAVNYRLADRAAAILSWQGMASLIRRHLDKNPKVVKE